MTHRKEHLESIGSRIRRLRSEQGMGQERLAMRAHIDQSGLSKFERNSKGLGDVALQKIAGVLQIGFEALVEGTDYRTVKPK
jgi:transcriptional regulator with XRE-family HTH domain